MKKIVFLSVIGCIVCLTFTGCPAKECQPEIKTVYDVKEVVKYVPCNQPKINCDFTGENFIPAKKLLACVVEQKRVLELCNNNTSN